MIEITLDTTKIRETFISLVPQLQSQIINKATQVAFDYIQDAADRHTKSSGALKTTGALFRSVKQEPIPGGYAVGHDLKTAPHAVFVHWGSPPHDIYPKNKKILRWTLGNSFVFAKHVNHPGYKGDPWIIEARNAAHAAMLKAIQELTK